MGWPITAEFTLSPVTVWQPATPQNAGRAAWLYLAPPTAPPTQCQLLNQAAKFTLPLPIVETEYHWGIYVFRSVVSKRLSLQRCDRVSLG